MDSRLLANHLYEVGTLRFTPRVHQQVLLSDDKSDNVASHSYRVSIIGLYLAELENVDTLKVLKMCLFHDLPEARSGDQNWVHKKYVKVFEDEIIRDQLAGLPVESETLSTINEYRERKSPESIVAKDADLLDQILILKEYEHAGNIEAAEWIKGKDNKNENAQISNLKTDSAKKIGKAIIERGPSEWWKDIWTNLNR